MFGPAKRADLNLKPRPIFQSGLIKTIGPPSASQRTARCARQAALRFIVKIEVAERLFVRVLYPPISDISLRRTNRREGPQAGIVSHAKLTRPPTEAAFLSRCGDSNRLFHDLRLITLADRDRAVIAVERFIAQLGLPLPGIENEVAL